MAAGFGIALVATAPRVELDSSPGGTRTERARRQRAPKLAPWFGAGGGGLLVRGSM